MTRSGGPTPSSQARAGANSASNARLTRSPRHRDVVGRLRLHVGDQHVEHLAALVLVAVARPVDVAERALARELDQPRLRQRRQMRVGQMGEREGAAIGARLPRNSLRWNGKLATPVQAQGKA